MFKNKVRNITTVMVVAIVFGSSVLLSTRATGSETAETEVGPTGGDYSQQNRQGITAQEGTPVIRKGRGSYTNDGSGNTTVLTTEQMNPSGGGGGVYILAGGWTPAHGSVQHFPCSPVSPSIVPSGLTFAREADPGNVVAWTDFNIYTSSPPPYAPVLHQNMTRSGLPDTSPYNFPHMMSSLNPIPSPMITYTITVVGYGPLELKSGLGGPLYSYIVTCP